MSEGGEMTDKTLPENFKWSQFVQSGEQISDYVESVKGKHILREFEKIFNEADKRKES